MLRAGEVRTQQQHRRLWRACSNAADTQYYRWPMMTSSNGNIFRVTGYLCGEFAGHRSPHKGQWRGALRFILICAWMNGWVNNREACDLIRHCAHYDVTIMHDHRLFGRGVDILNVMKENLFTPQTSKEQSICANDYDLWWRLYFNWDCSFIMMFKWRNIVLESSYLQCRFCWCWFQNEQHFN